ncbi:MAG: hypothetical protein AAF203_09915, partial [Pseudomonadota bacterium]
MKTIKVAREKHPTIELTKGEETHQYDLDTHYRWSHSFGGNALLFVYAPIGWVTDFITGAAWKIEDYKSPQKENFDIDKSSSIFVLPPIADSLEDSNQLGPIVEKWVKDAFPKAIHRSFENARRIANFSGFDFQTDIE